MVPPMSGSCFLERPLLGREERFVAEGGAAESLLIRWRWLATLNNQSPSL